MLSLQNDDIRSQFRVISYQIVCGKRAKDLYAIKLHE